ncbi:MAG: 4Fe-4S binding protein [Deltaproteobacteria bacterium]|nr:4Fe-4S binding protein [Deltaproteobacteria bacterium]
MNSTHTSSAVAGVEEGACRGCGACVNACPENAISVDNDVAVIDTRRCLGCAECIDSCPFGAISIVRNDN